MNPGPSPKAREPEVLRAGEDGCPSSTERKCALTLPFCSIQALDAHPPWGGRSSLLSLLIQMLISSRNTLTDPSRNNDLPAIWASFSPVKLTQKLNHHET